MQTKLLSVQEVADIFRLSKRTIMELARKNELPAIKVSRYWMFDEEKLNTFIDKNTKFKFK